MQSIMFLLVFLALPVLLLFFRVGFIPSAAVLIAAMLGWTIWIAPPILLAAIMWIIVLPPVVLLSMTGLRRQFLTEPVFAIFSKLLPSMSKTEEEALDAGDVWWDGELFSGAPDWRKLFSLPKPELTPKEQAFVDGPVDKLCAMIEDWKVSDELGDFPPDVWRYMKENKFFGMIIPEIDGGLGFSAFAHSEVIAKIASRSLGAAVTVMVPNSLGPAELIMHYGTKEQKEKYLSRLATGEEMPCFALTGPEAGSDASSIPDKGVVVVRNVGGEEVTGMLLTFDKRYITLAPIATVIALAFHLYDPDKILGGEEDVGITVALVPADTPGVRTDRKHNPLNVPFLNGTVRGTEIFVPLDTIVGGRNGAGKGWKMLMERLAVGRSVSLPALSTAAAKVSAWRTGAYARVRKQFKLPVGRFDGVAEKLARIAGLAYIMDAARKATVLAVDNGSRPAVLSALVKYNTTEMMRITVDDAMDVHGGSGIIWGPRNVIGRAYMSVPIGVTVEGANILTRTLIVFGQGMIRCHPYMLAEMRAAMEAGSDRHSALEKFDSAFWGHVGFVMSNAARSFVLGLTSGWGSSVPNAGALSYYARQANRLSAAFALTADTAAAMFGGGLRMKEMITGRMADALSALYFVSTSLKRFADDGKPAGDIPAAAWGMEKMLHLAQESIIGVLDNLPVKPVGWLLRLVIFPLGRPYHGPSDRLTRKAADLLMQPGDTRDRLSFGIYKNISETDPTGHVERAFTAAIAAEPAEKAIREAQKAGRLAKKFSLDDAVSQNVITRDQAELIRKADELRAIAVAVDEIQVEQNRPAGSGSIGGI